MFIRTILLSPIYRTEGIVVETKYLFGIALGVIFLALLIFAIVIQGQGGYSADAHANKTIDKNITEVISDSSYLTDNHLKLDASSIKLVNQTPYGIETQQDFIFKATDGSEHNCSAYMYNNDPSDMRIMTIDGISPENSAYLRTQ